MTDSTKKRQEFDINNFEKKVFSQNGEDGIIEFIFSQINTTNEFFVEIGVGNGEECNSRLLAEKRWQGIMMDNNENQNPNIKKEFVTAENINFILKKYNVPEKFDLLSIDIDYNDYWVWKSLDRFSPRLIIIEYNATIPPTESKAVKYDKNAKWDGTNYFGASLLALKKLADKKGYMLVGCDSNGVNAFFVRNEELPKNIKIKDVEELYKPPKYGKKVGDVFIGHGFSKKTMIDV